MKGSELNKSCETALCENEICGRGMNNSTSCRNKTIYFNFSTVK